MKKALVFCSLLLLSLNTIGQNDETEVFIPAIPGPDSPLVAAHRGGFDSDLPENSLALFDLTIRDLCRTRIALEFDIREGVEGTLFVMHDESVDRTTNGHGQINNLTDNYLVSLLLKDRKGQLSNEKIPYFEEILSHFRHTEVLLLLDVKGRIHDKVIGLVKEMHMEKQCIILTFNHEVTRQCRSLTTEMMISALVTNKQEWESIKALSIPSKQLIAYFSDQTSGELLKQIASTGVTLMTDMSESLKNNNVQFDAEYYRGIIRERFAGILITDFPVFVSALFCDN